MLIGGAAEQVLRQEVYSLVQRNLERYLKRSLVGCAHAQARAQACPVPPLRGAPAMGCQDLACPDATVPLLLACKVRAVSVP